MVLRQVLCPECKYTFSVDLPTIGETQSYILTCPKCKLKCKVTLEPMAPPLKNIPPLQNGLTPRYCGRCGSALFNGGCPKCGENIETYLAVSYNVPSSLKRSNICTWISGFLCLVMTIAIATNPPTDPWGNPDYHAMWVGIIGMGASFGYAFSIINTMDKIKKTGVRQCHKCRRIMSPEAKRCIYCKRRLYWG